MPQALTCSATSRRGSPMIVEARSFIVYGAAAVALRRRLGTTAWVVLEQLLARSHGSVERCAAEMSVRSLAIDLGISKDAVARALRRLRETGIVTAEQSRASSGAFTSGSYLIDVPTCITLVEPPVPSSAKPRPLPLASRTALTQHSLFDVDPVAS